MRKVYHVTPHPDGGWQSKAQGAERASLRTENKVDAVQRTIEVAKNHPQSQVIIHKADGTIQEERTYGNDPYPPKG